MADRNDESSFFSDRYKPIGQDRPAIGVLPANQRLESGQPAALEFNYGLVLNEEFVSIDCAAEVGLELQKVHGAGVHAFIEYDVSCLTERLGLIHGGIGIAQEILRELIVWI
jgi:hypothetical protein